jgi:hypothetical protein
MEQVLPGSSGLACFKVYMRRIDRLGGFFKN